MRELFESTKVLAQICFVPVEHRWPIGLIYAATASLWAYLCTAALVQDQPGLIWLKFTALAVVIACWQGLRWMETARRAKLRKVVKHSMGQLLGSNGGDSQGKLVETVVAQSILGVDNDVAKRRVAYHWRGYEQKRDSRAASALLSAVTDLPGRWIESPPGSI